MTKYVCPVCNKVEWSNGHKDQTGNTHPRICIHGDMIIIMESK